MSALFPQPDVPPASSRSARIDRMLTFRWPNVLGHREYRLCYVRQQTRGKAQLTDATWDGVERLMHLYAERVGCVDRRKGVQHEIDAPDMKALLDRVLEHGESVVRAIILDKFDSLRMSGGWKKGAESYVNRTPKSFFDSKFDYWLGISKAVRDQQAKAKSDQARKAQAARDDERLAREKAEAATPDQVRAAVRNYFSGHPSMQEQHAAQDAHWATLSDAQQREFINIAELRHCSAFGAASVATHHRDAVNRNARKLALEGASK